MPSRRIVLVLVDVDRARWEAAAFVRGVTLERFVRDAVEHRIGCHTGDYRPHLAGDELVDAPWTERERDHAVGSDCAWFAISWCFKLRRHRPGYCKGATNFDDVEDDINVNTRTW